MRLGRITGLFGSNSSGKSSIIQSLLLLKQTLESSDRSLPLHFGGERDYVELGLFKDVVWAHDKDESITFCFHWNLDKGLKVKNPDDPTNVLFEGDKIAFTTTIDAQDGEKLKVRRFAYDFGGKEFAYTRKEKSSSYQLSPTEQGLPFRFIRFTGRSWELPQPFKFHGFSAQTFSYYQNTGFLSDFQSELEELFSHIYYLGPLREYPKRRYTWSGSEPIDVGQRGERAIDAILAAKDRGNNIKRGRRKKSWTLDQMLAHQLKEMGLIHSFSVDRIVESGNDYRVMVQKNYNSAKVLLTDVGFGVSQVLPVLVLCYYVPEGSTIIFEQPEIHLHPSVQSHLADVFIDVALNRNVQVIVESHSEHLLNRLQRRMAEEKITPDDIALYFCEIEGNESKLKQLQLDLFGNISNWPKDFFGDRFEEVAKRQEAALDRKIKEEEKGIG
jgi:predicted ATPase